LEESEKKELNEELKKLETVALVNKHFKEAANYRKGFEAEWEECEDFYACKHWKDKSRTFKNILFPLIEQEMSQLCDSMPGTDVLAYQDEKEDAAKVLESAIHSVYEQENLQLKQVMSIRSMLKTGNGFQYVDFDPDADQGQGRVTIKNVPWRHVFLDPAASDIDEASFVGIKFPIRVAELKRRFPKFKDRIKAEGADEDGSSTSYKGKEDKDTLGRSFSSDEDKYQIEGMTTLEEAWLRDYSMVEISEEETASEIEKETEEFFNGVNPDIGRYEDHVAHDQAHSAQELSIVAEALQMPIEMVTEEDIQGLIDNDPQGIGLVLLMIKDHRKIHAQYHELNPEGKKPKFNSSIRLILKTGSTILYDDSAPVDDGMVPLVPYYAYKEEDSIYAFGEIKNAISSQKSYNEMDYAEFRALKLVSNPGFVIDANCGVSPSQITNKDGVVYVKNPGTEFRRLEPGQVSPQLANRKASDEQAMYAITGVNEASQGKATGSVTAARAIEALQQTTAGRIRLKATQIALYSMPRLGKLVASRIVKYYTTERLMRITDHDTGEIKRVVFDPEQIKDLKYEIRVVPGTLAGTDKAAIYSALSGFVDKGWMTPKMFFQVVDVPYKRKILEELEASDQLNQQMQMLAQENEQLKAMINGAPVQAEQLPPEQMEPQTV
jgi:hypothetical protein